MATPHAGFAAKGSRADEATVAYQKCGRTSLTAVHTGIAKFGVNSVFRDCFLPILPGLTISSNESTPSQGQLVAVFLPILTHFHHFWSQN
jgi:hypothetical protein